MYAVPLVVRGRSVAVLYADSGKGNEEVDIEVLETLVRVASLTIEILAWARGAQTQSESVAEETTAGYSSFETSNKEQSYESQNETAETVEEKSEETAPVESYQFAESEAEETPAEAEKAVEEEYSYISSTEEDYSYKPIEQPAESFEEPNYREVESDSFAFKPSVEPETAPSEFVSENSADAVEEVSMTEETPVEEAQTFETAPAWGQTVETEDYYSKEPSSSFEPSSYEPETSRYDISEPQTFETEPTVAENEYAPSLSSDYQFETNQSFEAPQTEFESTPQTFETPSYEAPEYEAESFVPTNGTSYDSASVENSKAESYVAETPVETVTEAVVKQPAKSRFSERNVDLPIEVSEDERRLHNDARRFARLLVSEIKLYNEQKVKEGREGNDLYERLREAIDRSREMYDKRVQPPVAAKFDYFHYELVSNLAEGDANKLGASYPGANV